MLISDIESDVKLGIDVGIVSMVQGTSINPSLRHIVLKKPNT